MICARCVHANEDRANFCSSCGTPLRSADEEATLTLAAVAASEEQDDRDRYLENLPAGDALLVVRQGPAAGSTYRLDPDVTTIGRHPDSNIFLDDITVSRRHAEIERSPSGFVLTDVGSLNGTYLNRERIDRAVLSNGDELQIGKFRLVFLLGD